MNKWQIRPATQDDATSLQDCMEAAYSPYLAKMAGSTLPPMEADYTKEIENYPTWVAIFNGNLVGGLIMTFGEDSATISNIAVDPNAQGLGLGRGLLNFAENEASIRNYTCMCLATHVLLTENLSIYKHLGWHVTGQDEVRVYMQKDI